MGQFALAAKLVYVHLGSLEWIRVADPEAGVADDFQFKAGSTRHALQVKSSQFPSTFTWSNFLSPTGDEPGLLGKLADAWKRIRETWDGPLRVHLCSNNFPQTSTPAAGSPLDLATVDGPKHFASFIKQSLEPTQAILATELRDLGSLRDTPAFASWASAWQVIQDATRLSDDEFVAFLRDFELNLGLNIAEEGIRSSAGTLIEEHSAADLKVLAWTLQELVADASRPVHVDREDLIVRLGWQSRLTFRNRHQFPVPGTYATNEVAETAIQDAFSQLSGGYLALIGPAGSGKSTLLSNITIPGRVVRYYAFVPDSPDPLSGRGEAESFLSDLSLALHEAGLSRRSQPVGLPNLRAAVQEQLALAAEVWSEQGQKTVIVIDGLDHVPREQNPIRSMLEELPMPNAIGDGVFVLLGSQATNILPQPILAALEGDEQRIIELPPLSSREVRALAEQSALTSWMWPGQVDKLIEVSEGHPLALAYLLEELVRIPGAEQEANEQRLAADNVLTHASQYGGDVEQRYRGYFKAVSDDTELVDLLGKVARLRTSPNIAWIREWVPPAVVGRFVAATRTFFRCEGEEWQFIHNSFRRFLIDESAKVGGRFDVQRDRSIHAQLAEQCAAAADNWPVYRDEEIAHRFLADQYDIVLQVATPAKLRGRLSELHALSTVSDHTGVALRAAAESDQRDAYVALALFSSELIMRNQVLEHEKLVGTLAEVLDPGDVLDHVVRAGKLLIPASSAMKHAARWASDGHLKVAAAVLNACNGLADLDATPLRAQRSEPIADWAEATLGVSGIDAVLTQLDRYRPLPVRRGASDSHESRGSSEASPGRRRAEDEGEEELRKTLKHRTVALARCVDCLVEVRDDQSLDRLMAIIDRESSLSWRARARIVRAIAAMKDGIISEVMRWTREVLELETEEQLSSAISASPHNPGEDHAAPTNEEEVDLYEVEYTCSADEAETLAHADSAGHNSDQPARAGQRRLALGLRLKTALVLVEAGLHDTPEIGKLVDDGETASTADDLSGEAMDPFREALNLWILENFRNLAQTRETEAVDRQSKTLLAELPIAVDEAHVKASPGEPATIVNRTQQAGASAKRTGTGNGAPENPARSSLLKHGKEAGNLRFLTALRTLADAHAQHLAYRAGIRTEPPILALCAEQILRIREVPAEQARDWTGWYRVREAMPELLENLISLSARSGGSAELLRLARQFDSAWAGDRAQYWPVELQQAALTAFAQVDDAAFAWIKGWLDTIDPVIGTRGYDPASQVDAWLQQAAIRGLVGQPREALDAVRSAVAAAASVGQLDDSEQLAHWIDWLVAARDFGTVSAEQFIEAGTVFASRLLGASQQDATAASTAAERLIAEIWPVSPGAARRVGMALCEAGVVAEADWIQAAVLAACADMTVDPKFLALVTTKLLLPIQKHPSNSLRPGFEERGDAEALALLDLGFQTWTVDGPFAGSLTTPRRGTDSCLDPLDADVTTEVGDVEGEDADAGRSVEPVAAWPRPLSSPTGFLSQLRRVPTPAALSATWWDEAAAGPLEEAPISSPVAAAILEQADRLNPPPGVFGKILTIAAGRGHLERALQALQSRLSRLPGGGWSRYYDGGSRRELFEAVLTVEAPELRTLALRDLAESITSQSLHWSMTGDLKNVLEVIAGPEAVAGAWPTVEAYLDVFAPATTAFVMAEDEATSSLPDTGTIALVTLIADFLDHPARAPQEAAQRILAASLLYAEDAIFSLLAAALSRGDSAEAALQVLAISDVSSIPPELGAEIDSAAMGNDAICRDLARMVCEQVGRPCPHPLPRELPGVYRLELPNLPDRRFPELDREGTPFVDTNDPQQVIAPFDSLLTRVAEGLGLDPVPFIYRASYLAQTRHGSRWTDAGHKGMAERLKRRGQQHNYRPWAYLVGRRALAQVLADLVDAQTYRLPRDLATRIGLVAPHLLAIEPEPLTVDIPGVWRPEETRNYDTRAWCDETADAAELYKDRFDRENAYVLAEASEWHSLDWGHPVEERRIYASHGRGSHRLLTADPGAPWDHADSSRSYPLIASEWAQEELVVEGQERFSNAPFFEWWAFHPAAAAALDWKKDPGALFGWTGDDGKWRARTEYRVRGLLSHSAPARTYCANVWRVVLSPVGRSEVGRIFPGLSRSLVVTRILQENRREGRPRRSSQATVTLTEPMPTSDDAAN